MSKCFVRSLIKLVEWFTECFHGSWMSVLLLHCICVYVCCQCLTACDAACWQLMRFGNRIASGNHHSHSGSGANFYCRLPQNARTAHKWLSFVVTKFTVFHVDAVNCSGIVHGYVVNIVANKVEWTTGCCFACCRIFDDSHFHSINSDASMFSIPKMKICMYVQASK